MMRPTPRAVLMFAAAVPLSLVLVIVDPALWPFGAGLLVLAILATGMDAILATPVHGLAIDVTPPTVLYVGDAEDLVLSISVAADRRPVAAEIVCDVGDILETPNSPVVAVPAGARVDAGLPLRPLRRGTAAVERLWVRWHGPFGLTSRQVVRPLDVAIPVVANVRAVRQAAIAFTSRDAPFGVKSQPQAGEGSEFEALREYVPGLDPRAIDWKHSARHRALICKEFRTERNHQIVLAVDTGHLMNESLDGIPKLDHAINASLLLAYASLRHGDRVGLFGFDSRVRLAMSPVSGVGGFERLRRAAAGLDYHTDETNYALGLTRLTANLNRRSLIILHTDFVDTITAELMIDNLRLLGRRHLVLFVVLSEPELGAMAHASPTGVAALTRAVIADDFLRERRVVLERLRRLGIHCLEAPGASLGVDLVNRYLDIKRHELI
jgi:uncharacterized protein (DUF58 family)